MATHIVPERSTWVETTRLLLKDLESSGLCLKMVNLPASGSKLCSPEGPLSHRIPRGSSMTFP